MHGPFPEDVDALLRERVASFEQLEALLLLRQRNGSPCPAAGLGSQLGIGPSAAEEALDRLRAAGLARHEAGGWRYGPESAPLERAVTALADAYQRNRVEVMKWMSTNAIERLRTSALKAFSDAFLVSGRKRDG